MELQNNGNASQLGKQSTAVSQQGLQSILNINNNDNCNTNINGNSNNNDASNSQLNQYLKQMRQQLISKQGSSLSLLQLLARGLPFIILNSNLPFGQKQTTKQLYVEMYDAYYIVVCSTYSPLPMSLTQHSSHLISMLLFSCSALQTNPCSNTYIPSIC